MISRAYDPLDRPCGRRGRLLSLFGCSSGKPYSLVASCRPPITWWWLPSTWTTASALCAFASLDWNDFYTPACKVLKDQSGFKSFNIGGTQMDFGAVDKGFKVLSTPPKLPGC